MGTDRLARSPQNNAFRIALVVGIALLSCMGFLYAVSRAPVSGNDEAGHTITITTAYASAHADMKTDHAAQMEMGSMTHYDMGVWSEKKFTVPEDMWITEFSSDFTGTSVHNFYLFIQGTHDAWCPENPTAVYSGGTVSAARPITFDPPYGVFLKKGTVLTLKGLYPTMANDSADVSSTFSIHARYEPAASTTRSVPISLHYITPGPCIYTRPVFSVPAHAKDMVFSSAQKPFVFPEDGRILKAMAHFHAAYEKGVANTVRLFLNGTRIDSFTTTDVGDGAERNPRLLTDRLVKVHRGDILTMHAIFSNPGETPVPEGMAIIGFYFAPQTQ